LLWCKSATSEYDGVNIESFKSGFKDGLAFLALVHKFSPNTTGVVFNKYSKDDPETNLRAAFDFAETELHIPKLLDVQEVMDGRVDERSLVLYTSLFFQAYKAADEANQLGKIVQSTEEMLTLEKKKNEQLVSEKRELEARIEELKLIIFQKEEQNLTLDGQKKKLEQEYEELNLKLTANTQEIVELKMAAERKQAEDANQIKELSKKHTVIEEEIETFKNDIENFKVLLDSERKDKEDHQQLLTQKTEQDTVHRSGLSVLRRNLDQHIEDLHTWQKYLDSKDKHFLDFDREIKSTLINELDSSPTFVAELNELSGRLAQENEAMIKILKGKQAEAMADEIAKKRDGR